MKKFALLAVFGVFAGAAQAEVIDLSGLSVDGAAPFSFTYDQDSDLRAYAITYDLSYTAISPSWGSELNIRLEHVDSGTVVTADGSDANFADLGPDDVLFGWGDASGTFTFFGEHPIDIADSSGEWRVTLSDEFDDAGIDGMFNDGSSITIKKIPEPTSLLLVGLGGLFAIRRR